MKPSPTSTAGSRMRKLASRALRTIDLLITRATAGLSSADVRGLARGESLRRPDPRLQVHSRSFWFHIKPRYYHEAATRFTHTFRLGLLATVLGAVEALTGVFLMMYYTPVPERAYGDIVGLASAVPFGQLVRDIHRLAAELLIIVAVLHLVRTFLSGSYKVSRRFTWFTGVVLLLATLFMSFSGYLLPWDQTGYWAVTIGASLADKIPPAALGSAIKQLLLGGQQVGASGLLRFYMLHVWALPLCMLIIFAVHYHKVVRAGISLPASEEEAGRDTARRVPFERRRYYLADVLSEEVVFIQIVVLALLAAIFFGVYRGAALGQHADPLRTPLGVTAPWYFLWLQGLLALGNATAMGVFVPAVAVVLLLLLPYLDRNPSRRIQERRLAIPSLLAVCIVLGGLTWIGASQAGNALSPAQAVVQEMLPEEGIGPLRAMPWEAIQTGEWDTRTYGISSAGSALREVMAHYGRLIARAANLPGGYGKLIIQNWGPGLRKITARVFWEASQGAQQAYEQSVFVHESVQHPE